MIGLAFSGLFLALFGFFIEIFIWQPWYIDACYIMDKNSKGTNAGESKNFCDAIRIFSENFINYFNYCTFSYTFLLFC